MKFTANLIISALRMFLGLVLLILAAGVPAYFTECGRETVVAAGVGTPSDLAIAKIYLDAAKLSPAMLVAETSGQGAPVEESVKKLYEAHPQWIPAGGDEPFFEAFYSSLFDASSRQTQVGIYSILSTEDNRKKLLDFLSQAETGLVKKFISMRDLNTVIFPPAYSSAGAPFESAVLINALLAQSGDFDRKFLRQITATLELVNAVDEQKILFEKYCLATLTFAKDCDWTTLRTVFSHFTTLEEAYDFARVYSMAPDPKYKRILIAGLLVCGAPDKCAKYLADNESRRWEDFNFAFLHGEGALDFLLSQNKPIYVNSALARFLAPLCSPIKNACADIVADFPKFALALKVLLSIVGGYLLVRGFFRLFRLRRDTPKWYSPLALSRGLLESVVVSLLFFLFIEPEDFTIKIGETGTPPELRFAFEKVINTIGEETMKFETDTATIAAVALFLILQFTVYVFCLIRLSLIKRTRATPKLKLKLIENEENLFDLGLYIGLAGTVFSLILLTIGVVTASLMAAYASTLFGILFTALIKIVHVRRYKRKLLIESSSEE